MRKISMKWALVAMITLSVSALKASVQQTEGNNPSNDRPPAEDAGKNKVIKNLPILKPGPWLDLDDTHPSATFTVSASDLQSDQPINITATSGFSVKPQVIPANAQNATVTVTLNSTKKLTLGHVILRSGATRSYVNLKGYGSKMTTKAMADNPKYAGGRDAEITFGEKEGFNPDVNGFTMEFKVNTDSLKEFYPYAVTNKGIGFKAYINAKGMGLYNGLDKKELFNPTINEESGLGQFYNDDKRSHTYRYSFTRDNRIIIFKDNLLIDSVRATDYGTQPEFAVGNGDMVENLLKNPNFEGEFNTAYDNHIATKIEGWDVLIGDRYNSEQFIKNQEINNQQDFDNHILSMNNYKWADGWSASEIGQVIDVVPNETYTLSALVRGGIKKEGPTMGMIKIQEVQDNSLGTSVDVTDNNWQTYSLDYTTSAICKQIRIFFYLERDKWGATISPLEVDNVKLTGKSRTYAAKAGFQNTSTGIDYFTFDTTGAYAPNLNPQINISVGKSK